MTRLTLLNYALLGLLHRAPATGYELMQIFETTPLGGYSSSPGAIYPALKKLRAAALVEVTGDGAGGRGEVLGINRAGKAALKAWIRTPAYRTEDRAPDLSAEMLRFTFAGDLLTDRQQVTYLEQLQAALRLAVARLEAARETLRGTLRRNDRLAMDAGLMNYRSAIAWCAHATESLCQPEGEAAS